MIARISFDRENFSALNIGIEVSCSVIEALSTQTQGSNEAKKFDSDCICARIATFLKILITNKANKTWVNNVFYLASNGTKENREIKIDEQNSTS